MVFLIITNINLKIRAVPLVIVFCLITLLLFVGKAESEPLEQKEIGIAHAHRVHLKTLENPMTIKLEPVTIEIDGNVQVIAGESNHDKAVREAEANRLQALVQQSRQGFTAKANVEQWRPLVAKYFPANQVDNALRVMTGESGGRPDATNYNRNGSIDRGLFQINSCHGANSTYDPEANIRYASQLWSSQGWHPWVYARKIGLA